MHIATHILSGWCIGNCLPLTARERFFCMIAASVQDVDGLGIVFGQKAYWDYHHIVGHNVFFLALVAGVLTIFSTHRVLAFVSYLLLGHLHLLMDYYGSGPGWGIHYLWPVQAIVLKTEYAWELFSWQNIAAGYALLGWTIVIAIRQHRTPLEYPMPQLNQKLLMRKMETTARFSATKS